MSVARSTPLARVVALCLATVGAIAAAREAGAQRLAYVGSVQYATGDFVFAQRTWSAYVSNGVSWSGGRLRATASIPVVIQDARLLQYSGGGMMVPSGGMGSDGTSGGTGSGGMMGSGGSGGMMGSGAMRSHVGLGDPIGRVEVELLPDVDPRRSLSVVASTKAPLAGVSSGFGTGKWDVGAGLSTAWLLGQTSVFADAVYWKLGNPTGWSLRNAVSYGLSVGRILTGNRWTILASVNGASPIWEGLAAPVQSGLGVGYTFPSGSGINVAAAVGLTRTAPAIATSVGWRVPLTR